LIVQGSGTLTLAGGDTFSATTTILSSTLALASATSAITGGIVDDGTLLFAQGTNGSFAGSISGIGIRRLCQAEHWGLNFGLPIPWQQRWQVIPLCLS
jgi:autotransporter-associated beta strand protein